MQLDLAGIRCKGVKNQTVRGEMRSTRSNFKNATTNHNTNQHGK